MDRYRIVITADHFNALINKEELRLQVSCPHGSNAEVRIILSIIGYDYMAKAIAKANEKINFDDDSDDDDDDDSHTSWRTDTYEGFREYRQRQEANEHFTDAHAYFYEAFFGRTVPTIDLVLIDDVYRDPNHWIHFCRHCQKNEVQNHNDVCQNCLLRLP